MLSLQYKKIELPFEYPFTISKGTKTHQPALVVALRQGALVGYGEAPAITYYNTSVENMIEVLEQKKTAIERYALTEPKRFWHFLHHLLPGQNFLTAALDMAACDLFAKRSGRPLFTFWHKNPFTPLKTDYTLGIDHAEDMLRKMQAHPWPIYKIKISQPADLDKIKLLRQHTDAPFRVDANESLTYEDVGKIIPELKSLGVRILEQPLPKEEHDAMVALKAQSEIPLFADESFVELKDIEKVALGFHGINVKLTKCGGLTPALDIISKAKTMNLQVMLGCMNETQIGSAALAHLSPLAHFLDLDGPLLLKDDRTTGLNISAKDGV